MDKEDTYLSLGKRVAIYYEDHIRSYIDGLCAVERVAWYAELVDQSSSLAEGIIY